MTERRFGDFHVRWKIHRLWAGFGGHQACKSNGAQTPWQVMAHDHGVISCLGLAASGASHFDWLETARS